MIARTRFSQVCEWKMIHEILDREFLWKNSLQQRSRRRGRGSGDPEIFQLCVERMHFVHFLTQTPPPFSKEIHGHVAVIALDFCRKFSCFWKPGRWKLTFGLVIPKILHTVNNFGKISEILTISGGIF